MKVFTKISVMLALIGLSFSSAMAQNVYVGGIANDKATVWKNGVATAPLSTEYGLIYSIVVDNGSVYAAGVEHIASISVAKVWKDNIGVYAVDNAAAFSVAVSGNDVYMAGVDGGGTAIGKVWENGVAMSGYADAEAIFSVFISDGNIYAAGVTNSGQAVVWKNGDMLFTLTAGTYSIAKSVVVVDGDVYTAGYGTADGDNWFPGGFINDIPHPIASTGSQFVYALGLPLGLYISDNGDIYVAGHEIVAGKIVAKLWKNGHSVSLNTGGLNGTVACSVFVSGSDVYVAGLGDDKALLWKNNGAPTTLANNAIAYSVFVVAPPVITTETLPDGAVGTAYFTALTATGATPIIWSISSGSLPAGLSLNAATGEIYGIPTTEGTYSFSVKATNAGGEKIKALSIAITATGIAETALANITVHPNPTKGELIIATSDMRYAICDIAIFDVMGRKVQSSEFNVQSSTLNPKPETLNILHLQNGIYFLRIQTENGVITKKVVKN